LTDGSEQVSEIGRFGVPTLMNIRYLAAIGAAGVVAYAHAYAAPAVPTFSKDVAPILYAKCASCHRAGEMAPMSLLTYEDARPYARAIRTRVADGVMPPWHADAPHGTFRNDRRLTDAEKDTIVRWADGGAPKGDPKDLPPAPAFADGWTIGKPDAIISMPKPFDVPASGTIPYQYFAAPTNFTEDKWVQAIEIRPGARKVVHHVLVFSREPDGAPRTLPWVARNPNTPTAPQAPVAANAATRGVLIATTAPGTNAQTFEPGTAMLIKAGTILSFQIHYTATGDATTDTSSVGFVFATHPPAQEIRAGSFQNTRFVIPAGAADENVASAIEFTEDAHIWALFPHTHLRGKRWEYRLVLPDGSSKLVLSVPKYDFNWQTYYAFNEPLQAPKGSRLEATARYDNSIANRANPDPNVDVRWGDQTWQEMQYSGITYTVDRKTP
jgi:hypothetical protein